jgi:hypothetical protein
MTGLILSPTLNEFHFNGPLLSLAMNVGLLAGAILWSFGGDIWGRKSVTFQPSSPGVVASYKLYALLADGRSISHYSSEVYLE